MSLEDRIQRTLIRLGLPEEAADVEESMRRRHAALRMKGLPWDRAVRDAADAVAASAVAEEELRRRSVGLGES